MNSVVVAVVENDDEDTTENLRGEKVEKQLQHLDWHCCRVRDDRCGRRCIIRLLPHPKNGIVDGCACFFKGDVDNVASTT